MRKTNDYELEIDGFNNSGLEQTTDIDKKVIRQLDGKSDKDDALRKIVMKNTLRFEIPKNVNKLTEEFSAFFKGRVADGLSSDVNDKFQSSIIDSRFISTVLLNPDFDDESFKKRCLDTINLKAESDDIEDELKQLDDGRGGGYFNSKEFMNLLSIRKTIIESVEKYNKLFNPDKNPENGWFDASTAKNHILDLWYGSGGTGKTTMAKFVADRVYGDKEPIYKSCKEHANFDELLRECIFVDGKPQFIEGPLVKKMLYGGVLILDEMNILKGDVLTALQSYTDNKGEIYLEPINDKVGGKTIKIHPDFHIIGCFNLQQNQEGGRKFLPNVLIERAFSVVNFDTITHPDEMSIAERHAYASVQGFYPEELAQLEKDYADNKINDYELDKKLTELHKSNLTDGKIDKKKLCERDFQKYSCWKPYQALVDNRFSNEKSKKKEVKEDEFTK